MDFMYDQTEKDLQELEKQVLEVYEQASNDLRKKAEKYFSDFRRLDEKKLLEVEQGNLTMAEYNQWRMNKYRYAERFKELSNSYANTMTNANEVAQNIINGNVSDIFLQNANYNGYVLQANTKYSFAVYDQTTIARLIKEEPNLLPLKEIDGNKSIRWNEKQVARQITQGILQGESIDKIAKRLYTNIPEMNKNSALTNARTAVTSAQNAGRMYRNEQAREELGVDVVDVWSSAIDSRTRTSHRHLNGQERAKDGYFHSIDGDLIEYPGDPNAKPSEVYNCRCAISPKLPNYNGHYQTQARKEMESKEYQQWLKDEPISKHIGESKAEYEKRLSK